MRCRHAAKPHHDAPLPAVSESAYDCRIVSELWAGVGDIRGELRQRARRKVVVERTGKRRQTVPPIPGELVKIRSSWFGRKSVHDLRQAQSVRLSHSFRNCKSAILASTPTVNCAPCKGVFKIGGPRPFSILMIDGLRRIDSPPKGYQVPLGRWLKLGLRWELPPKGLQIELGNINGEATIQYGRFNCR
jgi:hypothetical protein